MEQETITVLIGFALTAVAQWVRSRQDQAKTAAKIEESTADRVALLDAADKYRQQIAGLTMQRDLYLQMVRYVKKHPEGRALLDQFAARRRTIFRPDEVENLVIDPTEDL